jgi:magnesium transporter
MTQQTSGEQVVDIMLRDFPRLQQSFTAREALAFIRETGPSPGHEYYIVDERHRPMASVSLDKLVFALPTCSVKSIATPLLTVVQAGDDQEVAARALAQGNEPCLPVVDDSEVLVGLVSYDEGLKILGEEDQQDIERMMGIAGEGSAVCYQQLSVAEHIRNRVGWLVALALLGFVSGSILMRYESVLDQLVILAIYLPMIADTGGNAGGQSASVIIRALALGEVSLKHTWRILRREFLISLGLAAILALVALFRIWWLTSEAQLAGAITLASLMLCISMALVAQVISSTFIGAGLPLLVSYFNRDPAVVASPAITTIVDISGLLIYFSAASYFLGL